MKKVIIILIALGLIGGGTYLYLNHEKSAENEPPRQEIEDERPSGSGNTGQIVPNGESEEEGVTSETSEEDLSVSLEEEEPEENELSNRTFKSDVTTVKFGIDTVTISYDDVSNDFTYEIEDGVITLTGAAGKYMWAYSIDGSKFTMDDVEYEEVTEP